MKIVIKLNDMNFRYDVYQIFNLFYSFSDIVFSEKDNNFEVNIHEKIVLCRGLDSFYEGCLSDEKKEREGLRRIIFIFLQRLTGKELPWGILIGIRPSKIAMQLLMEGKTREEIIDYYLEHYLMSRDKAELCISIAEMEKKTVNAVPETISVYIGMPFCPTRCMYCSFTSNPAGRCKKLIKPYLQALKLEIEAMAGYIRKKNLKVQCVYFGGGTPTSIENEEFEEVMQDIYRAFVKDSAIKEFTVECGRADSITLNKLTSMRKYGVQRISINPQTMNDETLKSIGRRHSAADVREKFQLARNLGFDNINMDIIVGLPGEMLTHIKRTCEEIAALKPDNLTVHGLCVKRGSKLHENIINNIETGNAAGQDELNAMYKETVFTSEVMNMKPYYMYKQKNMVGNMENVGYSIEGKEGLYNIQMIEERQTIIALGADAVTKVVFLDENRIERFANVKDVNEYILRIDEMIDKKVKLLDSLYTL